MLAKLTLQTSSIVYFTNTIPNMSVLRKLPVYILLFIGMHTAAQPSLQYSLDSLAGAFIQNLRQTEPLQTYIHTDKSIYRVGETIWVRTFLLNSFSQRI